MGIMEKIKYSLFVFSLIAPSLAAVIYLSASLATINIENRINNSSQLVEEELWESTALLLCPLH
tara:strand:+ start:2099 stop:2290 length:192 start_codon:yes stop_codon:yes gene_type:complete